MAGSVGGSGSDPEFQVAPMIDVLLVLLIFFMSITTDQILKVDKSIKLPLAKNARERKVDLQNQVVVNVDWNAAENKSHIKYENQDLDSLEKLQEVLEPRVKANPKLQLIIRGDDDTPALEVQKVIEQLAAAGIDNISLSGVNR